MKNLEDLLRDAAALVPERVALVDAAGSLTYRELDAWSNALAAELAELGVGPGARVAVWAPKSGRCVAALQAVLRLGAAYVPIDAGTPRARATAILDDCQVSALVTTRALGGELALPQLYLDEVELGAPAHLDRLPARPDALAYVLYTSGSTGTPKGVCISHRNALAFVDWAIATLAPRDDAVFANHASFGFDLSVLDLYGAFLARGRVCLVPEGIAYAAPQLVDFVARHGVNVWYSVPSVLVLMLEHGKLLDAALTPPETLIFAGEPFPLPQLRRLRRAWSGTRFFNFYGPTETNVCTSYELVGELPEDASGVPIGKAASGDRVWLVNDYGTDAAPGERGELWVEGPTVMLGYWGQPPQTGAYATGDLCLRNADGDYEFVGRRDQLVKVRGHRIELGDIESALARHENVREVTVLTAGEGLERKLVAFVVARSGPAPTLIQLKAFSAKLVPGYMLIDRLKVVEALPRTANGKVDREALLGSLPA
jgi:L-proline---[L-prolyl-carrier protein] ligase